MLKLQEEKPQQNQLVKELLRKISLKMMTLGFSRQEILQSILRVVNRVLKIKASDFREVTKVISNRLSEKQNKTISFQLIIELDLLLTSVHDNYDSEPEEKTPKVESHGEKGKEQERRSNGMSRGGVEEECPYERNHRSFSSFLMRGKQRRLFQKLGRAREVKLQFLNGQQF